MKSKRRYHEGFLYCYLPLLLNILLLVAGFANINYNFQGDRVKQTS